MAVVLLVVAGLAGCGGTGLVGRPPAATVSGRRITLDELRAAIRADQALAEYAKTTPAAAGLAADAPSLLGAPPNTLGPAGVAGSLTKLIQIRLLEHALDQLKGKLTAKDSTDAKTSLTQALTQRGMKINSLPAAFVAEEVQIRALELALVAAPPASEKDLRAAYPRQQAQYARLCVSVVLTKDAASANTAYARLQKGESMVSVSDALNVDPTTKASGGSAGCSDATTIAGSLGPSVVSVPIGVPIAPQPFTGGPGGYVVAVVTSRTPPTFASIRTQLANFVKTSVAAKTLKADEDKVTVDPRYGRWDATTALVVPPVASTPTTTRKGGS